MVRCAPSERVPTSMTVVTGCWLSNWNSHPTRTRIADPNREGKPTQAGRAFRRDVPRFVAHAEPFNRMMPDGPAVNGFLPFLHRTVTFYQKCPLILVICN